MWWWREKEVVALGAYRKVCEWVALGDGDGGGVACIGCGLLHAGYAEWFGNCARERECVRRGGFAGELEWSRNRPSGGAA